MMTESTERLERYVFSEERVPVNFTDGPAVCYLMQGLQRQHPEVKELIRYTHTMFLEGGLTVRATAYQIPRMKLPRMSHEREAGGGDIGAFMHVEVLGRGASEAADRLGFNPLQLSLDQVQFHVNEEQPHLGLTLTTGQEHRNLSEKDAEMLAAQCLAAMSRRLQNFRSFYDDVLSQYTRRDYGSYYRDAEFPELLHVRAGRDSAVLIAGAEETGDRKQFISWCLKNGHEEVLPRGLSGLLRPELIFRAAEALENKYDGYSRPEGDLSARVKEFTDAWTAAFRPSVTEEAVFGPDGIPELEKVHRTEGILFRPETAGSAEYGVQPLSIAWKRPGAGEPEAGRVKGGFNLTGARLTADEPLVMNASQYEDLEARCLPLLGEDRYRVTDLLHDAEAAVHEMCSAAGRFVSPQERGEQDQVTVSSKAVVIHHRFAGAELRIIRSGNARDLHFACSGISDPRTLRRLRRHARLLNAGGFRVTLSTGTEKADRAVDLSPGPADRAFAALREEHPAVLQILSRLCKTGGAEEIVLPVLMTELGRVHLDPPLTETVIRTVAANIYDEYSETGIKNKKKLLKSLPDSKNMLNSDQSDIRSQETENDYRQRDGSDGSGERAATGDRGMAAGAAGSSGRDAHRGAVADPAAAGDGDLSQGAGAETLRDEVRTSVAHGAAVSQLGAGAGDAEGRTRGARDPAALRSGDESESAAFGRGNAGTAAGHDGRGAGGDQEGLSVGLSGGYGRGGSGTGAAGSGNGPADAGGTGTGAENGVADGGEGPVQGYASGGRSAESETARNSSGSGGSGYGSVMGDPDGGTDGADVSGYKAGTGDDRGSPVHGFSASEGVRGAASGLAESGADTAGNAEDADGGADLPQSRGEADVSQRAAAAGNAGSRASGLRLNAEPEVRGEGRYSGGSEAAGGAGELDQGVQRGNSAFGGWEAADGSETSVHGIRDDAGGQRVPGVSGTLDSVRNGTERSSERLSAVRLVPGSSLKRTDPEFFDREAGGSPRMQCAKNIAALRLLKVLESENRLPDPEEMEVLLAYSGWGNLPGPFDESKPQWADEYKALKELLTDPEWDAARASVLDAVYTPGAVLKAIYKGLERFGCGTDGEKISVLEPSAGTGRFLGSLPQTLNADFTAVELDPVSARIMQRLYPGEKICNCGFQELGSEQLKPGAGFDAVIGNPPFGDFRVFDPEYSRELGGASVHSYFMAKAVDQLHEGGIGAFVVSRYFMDSTEPGAVKAREFIADRADLLGAVRLPSDSFENSRAQVTTDVVFFRRHNGRNRLSRSWTETVPKGSGDNTWNLNRYFDEHPFRMMGYQTMVSGRFGPEPAWMSPGPRYEKGQYVFWNFEDEFDRQLASMPGDVFTRSKEQQAAAAEYRADPAFISGSYFASLKRDQYAVEPSTGEIVMKKGPENCIRIDVSGKKAERIKGMIALRDNLRELLNEEKREDASEERMNELRSSLNERYDRYVREFGLLNVTANRKLFRYDAEASLVLSLENNFDRGVTVQAARKNGTEARAPSAEKAAVFSRRVLLPVPEIRHTDSPAEALAASINRCGRVDPDFMAGLLDAGDSREFLDELFREERIFPEPDGTGLRWIAASSYLSGDVKEKLQHAEEWARDNPLFMRNAEALKAVLPADLDAADISVDLSSTWIPDHVIREFADYLTDGNFSGGYRQLGGPVVTTADGYRSFIVREDDLTSAAGYGNTKFTGTSRVTAGEIFRAAALNKMIRVKKKIRDEDGTEHEVPDPDETVAAQTKVDELRDTFRKWLWEDDNRRREVTRIYNDLFNRFVPPRYDGSMLRTEGMNAEITLREHQKNAVMRNISEGRGLVDHVVGAGKTNVAIATLMESKRMGLVHKPMVIVPNHLLTQWRDEIYRLYPDAKVLIASKDELSDAADRDRMYARIATGEWDMVVMTHSSFTKVDMPAVYHAEFLKEELHNLTEAINEGKGDGRSRTLRDLEQRKKTVESQIRDLEATCGERMKSLDFTDLGVDCLVVDEAHEFKNLFNTCTLDVKGLGTRKGSAKAMDLFLKTRWLMEKNNGRGVYFLTGTPISNSLSELYTMQRYLDFDTLQKCHLTHANAWVNTFGDIRADLELDSTGQNYKSVIRLAGIKNCGEMIGMYRSFADVVTQSDLAEQAKREGRRPYVPGIEGGKPENIVVERSPEQSAYMDHVVYRMEHLPTDSRIDNALKITNDARLCGLDMRTLDPGAPDFEGSKVNECAKRLFRIWQETRDVKGTQLVFCDLSTPGSEKRRLAAKKGKGRKAADAEGDGVYQSASPEEASAGESDEEGIQLSADDVLALQSDFSVYDDLKAKLVKMGIPEHQIAFIHDAGDSDERKGALFERVRNGDVRILMGSTRKMGSGVNVQTRLVAAHHLDAPWRPSDLEQRNGRIIRQGNLFYEQNPDFKVRIYNYATERTYDARMWQLLENKSRTIEQFRAGTLATRSFEDMSGGSATAEEMKAAASGNPLIYLQVQLEQEKRRYEGLYKSWFRSHTQAVDTLKSLRNEDPQHQIELIAADRQRALKAAQDGLHTDQDGKPLKELFFDSGERIAAGVSGEENVRFNQHIAEVLRDCLAEQSDFHYSEKRFELGTYRNFRITAVRQVSNGLDGMRFILTLPGNPPIKVEPENLRYQKSDITGEKRFMVGGFFTRLNNFLDAGLKKHFDLLEENNVKLQGRIRDLEVQAAEPFKFAEELDIASRNAQRVMRELNALRDDPSYVSRWVPEPMPDDHGTTVEAAYTEVPAQSDPVTESVKTETENAVSDRPAADAVQPSVPETVKAVREAAGDMARTVAGNDDSAVPENVPQSAPERISVPDSDGLTAASGELPVEGAGAAVTEGGRRLAPGSIVPEIPGTDPRDTRVKGEAPLNTEGMSLEEFFGVPSLAEQAQKPKARRIAGRRIWIRTDDRELIRSLEGVRNEGGQIWEVPERSLSGADERIFAMPMFASLGDAYRGSEMDGERRAKLEKRFMRPQERVWLTPVSEAAESLLEKLLDKGGVRTDRKHGFTVMPQKLFREYGETLSDGCMVFRSADACFDGNALPEKEVRQLAGLEPQPGSVMSRARGR